VAIIRLDRAGAGLEPETVRLADHGIARHAAQFLSDLAGGGAAFPHAGQFVDAFFGPAHACLAAFCPEIFRSP